MIGAGVIPIISANARPDLCTPCGGQCCSTEPGTMYPKELSPTLDSTELFVKVHDLLLSNRWAIDWWEGDPEIESNWDGEVAYYLRPALMGDEGTWFHASYGGDCTFHGSMGCELSEAQRPTDCLTLTPDEQKCHHHAGWEGKLSGVKAWYPFRHILRIMLQYHSERE